MKCMNFIIELLLVHGKIYNSTEVLIYIQEYNEEYSDCLKSYLQCESQEVRMKVFDWLDRIFKTMDYAILEKFKGEVLEYLDRLVDVNSDKTAQLVRDWFEGEHAAIVDKLGKDPKL